MSGLSKNWMDCPAYLCHRPALGGKCAYPPAMVGGSAAGRILRTMNAALLTWGYHLLASLSFGSGVGRVST